MKVSFSWLADYTPIEMPASELADALTMAGLEVEAVWDRYDYLETVRVGRILRVSPHPNADRLRLCEVDIGDRQVKVVCGAPNAVEGMLSPLALPGTELPGGARMEKSVIRGETSEGMLCSQGELMLGSDRSGLMALDAGLTPGAPLAEALGLSDTLFEIGLTPNRPDCLSLIGIARETAAIQGTHLTWPEIALPKGEGNIHKRTSVAIQAPDHCPRYAARLIESVRIAPSPDWLRDRLISIGLKPINNVVDVTNFVMMEMGQPLHAFDVDRLAGERIVVRLAGAGEPFTTLDGKERILDEHMLMICDGEKPVAVGGVMGGLNSEIEETTARVLIESAYFDPASIRKTAKKLGLATDASHRFERGIDPEGAIRALDRAAQLILAMAGGTLIEGVVDERPKWIGPKQFDLSVSDTKRLLGITLDQENISALLRSIEFAVEPVDEDHITVRAPSFRVDVTRPRDLMEEVARLWGYNRIPTTSPLMPAEARVPSASLQLRNRLRDLLTGFGFTEAVNYSFIQPDAVDRLRLSEADPRRNTVTILNPLTEDQSVMRTSLLPGLLNNMGWNLARRVRDLKLFEVGKIFIGNGAASLPDEPQMTAGLWTGNRTSPTWLAKDIPCDFYDMKGIVEGVLEGLRIRDARFTRMAKDRCRYTRPGRTARILVAETEIGLIGEVHPETLCNFDLRQPAFYFELDLDLLLPLAPAACQSAAIPRYPAVDRDITLILDKGSEAADILDAIRNSGVPGAELIETITFFDAYEGEAIPPGCRSISFRITYRSPEETLEDERVNVIQKAIADYLLNAFKATLPGNR